MATRVNKFGLTDRIPAAVARAVRQECGFGCVVCGCPLIQYEHFDPPFDQANAHCVGGIALLCGGCHDPKSRTFWSQRKIADARRDPYNLRSAMPRGFAFDLTPPFTLYVGESTIQDVSCVVKTHEGDRWFEILPSEEATAPIRISAKFFDPDGKPSLEISENEWKPVVAQWDVEAIGATISVRNDHRSLALVLEALPPHGLRVVRLMMVSKDFGIDVGRTGRISISRDGDSIEVDDCSFMAGDTVFLV